MQAGPSRLAGQTRRCCRAFSSHGSPRCKAAPAVIGPDGADRAASAPLVSTTKSPGNLPLPSSPAASKSATAPQDGPTRAETTSRPDDRPQQPTQRARTGPQPASLGYPSIVRESPFVPRTAETTKGKERRLLVAESLKKLKVDGGRVEASPVFKGLLKREDDLPALPNKWSVRVVPATASTSEKVIWPAEIAQRALETLDPRLIVQVMNLPEYEAQELPHQLAVVLRRNGVLVKAIELDCAARQGRIVCSSIFDVTKLLALSGQKLRYSELFFWSDYAGVGDLIDPALQYKERVDGSLLVLSCSQPEAPQTWIDYRHDPKSLVAELEKRFPYRYLFRPLPRDGSDPGAGLIRLEVFPRDEDHPVSEIVEALHGRTLKGSRAVLFVKEVGLKPKRSVSVDGSPAALLGASLPKRAVLMSGLPREITGHELQQLLVEQLQLVIDAVWRHPVEGLSPSAPASATVFTNDEATYQKMLLVSGRLEMRGVPIGFVDLRYPDTAKGSPVPDDPLPSDTVEATRSEQSSLA